MKLACLLRWFLIGLLSAGHLPDLSGKNVTTLIRDVSQMDDGSIKQARLEAERQAQSGGLAYRSYSRGDNQSFTGEYTPPQLPANKKGLFVYGLALFSDDGCDVTVKKGAVHERLGRDQHLPNLGDSFHVLTVALAPGEPIEISVDYSNTIYDDEPKSSGYPDIDGCTLFLYLIPAAMAVDANRDGNIAFSGRAKDSTSQNAPFRFWRNDDSDGLPNSEGELVGPSSPDYEDGLIQTPRDLEDFARLHFYLDAFRQELTDGDLQMGLKFEDATGDPKIRVYRATDPGGSDSYLKSPESALRQVSGEEAETLGRVTSDEPMLFPKKFWTDAGTKYLLFEGEAEGKGRLLVTINKSDGTQIGEGPSVWLDIKNIKEMYQSSTGDVFQRPPNEDKQAILFVHGWNMSPEGSRNFAETMFKRIWHRGFKGRFAYFRWDTDWSDAFDNVPGIGEAAEAYFANYNVSEHRAWTQAGPQLRAFVQQIPNGYTKNIAAHSMGNIVVGSALARGMTINSYAMMQAAVPAACYDPRAVIRQTRPVRHTVRLNFWGHKLPIGKVTVWDERSPDNDPDPITRNLAYRGMLGIIGQRCNPINFYLPADNATSYAWEINNDVTKPPGGMSANFRYKRGSLPGRKLYKYYIIHNEIIDYYLRNRYEAVSFACRTWGKAAGAETQTEGAIPASNKVDLSSAQYSLPGQSNGFDRQHSAQFERDIQHLKPFYDTLLRSLDVDFDSQ